MFVQQYLERQLKEELNKNTFYDPHDNYRVWHQVIAHMLNHVTFHKNHIVVGSACSKVMVDFKKAFRNFIENNGYGICFELRKPSITLSPHNVKKNLEDMMRKVNNVPAPQVQESDSKIHILSRNIVMFLNDPKQNDIDICDGFLFSGGTCSLIFISCFNCVEEPLRNIFINQCDHRDSEHLIRKTTNISKYDVIIALPPYSHEEVRFAIKDFIINIFRERFQCKIEIDDKLFCGVLHGYKYNFSDVVYYFEPILRKALMLFQKNIHQRSLIPKKVEFKFIRPNKFQMVMDGYQSNMFEIYSSQKIYSLRQHIENDFSMLNMDQKQKNMLVFDLIYTIIKVKFVDLKKIKQIIKKEILNKIIGIDDSNQSRLSYSQYNKNLSYNNNIISIDIISKLIFHLNKQHENDMKIICDRKSKKKKHGSIRDKYPHQILLLYYNKKIQKWKVKTMNKNKHNKNLVLKTGKHLGISTQKLMIWDKHTRIYS